MVSRGFGRKAPFVVLHQGASRCFGVARTRLLRTVAGAGATLEGRARAGGEETCGASMAFHVACPYTCLAVCRCTQGTPSTLRDPKANARHRRQAKMLWAFWKDPENLLMPKEDVQLSLPPLDRRKIFDEERKIKRQLEDMIPAEEEGENETRLPSLAKAKQKLQRTEREATTYCSRALRAAQEAGVSWSVPEDAGIHVPLPPPLPNATPQTVERIEPESTKVHAQAEEASAAAAGAPMDETEERNKDAPEPMQVDGKTEDKEDLPAASNQPGVPDKSLMLKLKDIRKSLVGKQLLLFWPDEGAWYKVEVLELNAKKRIAVVLYDTGESEELELEDIVKNQEIAWNVDPGMPPEAPEEVVREDTAEEAGQPHPAPPLEREERAEAEENHAKNLESTQVQEEEQRVSGRQSKKSRRKAAQIEGRSQDALGAEQLQEEFLSSEEPKRQSGRKRKHLQAKQQSVPEQEEGSRSLKKIKIKIPTRPSTAETQAPTVELTKLGRLRLESVGLAGLQVGTKVSVDFPLAGSQCLGKVVEIIPDGTFRVEYDGVGLTAETIEEIIDVNHVAVSLA